MHGGYIEYECMENSFRSVIGTHNDQGIAAMINQPKTKGVYIQKKKKNPDGYSSSPTLQLLPTFPSPASSKAP